MEQTNLVVTADGKTWDEVTRDTSYIGPSTMVSTSREGGAVSSDNIIVWDVHRGTDNKKEFYNKNNAIAYDRFIILENGIYEVYLQCYNNTADIVIFIEKNNNTGVIDDGIIIRSDSADETPHGTVTWPCVRGDFISARVKHGGTNAMSGGNAGYSQFVIKKIN